MTTAITSDTTERTIRILRLAGWSLVAVLLAAPAVAMKLHAPGVDWSGEDFAGAALLLGLLGGLIELAVRASRNPSYRIASALAALMGFLTVWANLAVGIVGDEGNPVNWVFMGVVGVALVGAVLARGRAPLLAHAMRIAGALMLLAAPLAWEPNRVPVVFCLFAAAVWFTSGALFARAARQSAAAVG